MNNEEKKNNIRRQLQEAEDRHIENTRYLDMMEDIMSRSIARSQMARDNNGLSSAEIERLSDIESNGYRCINAISDKRDQLQKEYNNQTEQYMNELKKTENEEKEGNNSSERE
ncbi:MAG: hypothetical protein J6U54_10450 [Clostridiales bacterium]|nr:hypothetical protein [Clostridiales bacterium]